MQPDPIAKAARARLDPTEFVSIQLCCLLAAVRAILATHPVPDKARAAFDQLLGQMLANPAFVSNPDHGIVLRDVAATLFQPPVRLDT